MKIRTKILLITLPLIIIPAVIVGLVSFRVSKAAIQSIADNLLRDQLAKAIDICNGQAGGLQGNDATNPKLISQAQGAAAKAISTITFGKTGYVMVVDNAGFVISNPTEQTTRQNISGEAWFNNIYDKDKGSFTYTWEGKDRIAQFQRFPEWGWYVVSSETGSELLGPSQMLSIYISVLLTLSLTIAFLTILVLAHQLTAPIQKLVAGAERIRRGELEIKLGIKTHDEIGVLSNAITDMANQIRAVIGGLDQQVSERTRDLEQRAIQMQTASEIAREAVSTHDLEALLTLSVNLIQERLNYYYASIYSLDEQRQYAVLRAGSGENGKIMVQRGHRVRIGDVGFVSHVAGTGEAHVVNDVKMDYTYVRNPLLPNTACAATFPLKVGGRIIGVLNVEHDRVNTFNQDNIAVLQSLADQLAVAIENARLVEELRNSLKETRNLYQSYTQETWSRATKGGKIPGYQFDLSQISSYTADLPAGIQTRLLEGHPLAIQGKSPGGMNPDRPSDPNTSSDRSVLLVPLIMYNELIGVIGVENDNPKHTWSAEETALLEAISNQVSLTLDNARLVEETQLRSEQIRLLQEITATAASHVKLDELLDAVTQQLLSGFALSHCGVAFFNKDGNGDDNLQGQRSSAKADDHSNLTLAAIASSPGLSTLYPIGSKLPEDKNRIYQEVLTSRKAIVIYGDAGLAPTTLIAPLLTRGALTGVIFMEVANSDRRFEEEDLRLLGQIGLQVSTAIEVAYNFEQTANRAEYERLIGEMTTRIRETLSVETMVKTAVKEVQQALGLPEVVIRLGLPSTRTQTPSDSLPETANLRSGGLE